MKISVIILLLFSTLGFSQETKKIEVYLDEELKEISKLEFLQKSISAIYSKKTTSLDSFSINRLIMKYRFEKFSNSEFSQIQLLLKRDLNINDFGKTIIITYKDSIHGVNELNRSRFGLNYLDKESFQKDKEYHKTRKTFDRHQKKCNKLALKKNIISKHAYNVNNNYTYITKYHKQIKISKMLKSILFNNESHGMVIIKPDGNMLFYRYLTDDFFYKLIDNDWDKYIKEYYTAKNNISIRQFPFIKAMIEKNRLFNHKIAMQEIANRQRETKRTTGRLDLKKGTRITIKTNQCFSHSHY